MQHVFLKRKETKWANKVIVALTISHIMWLALCLCVCVTMLVCVHFRTLLASQACEAVDKLCIHLSCICMSMCVGACSFFWRMLVGIGRASNEGRWEKTRGREQWCSRSKNSTASMPLLPPMLLFPYPLHNPTISSFSSSSWQKKQNKLQVDEWWDWGVWGATALPHTSFNQKEECMAWARIQSGIKWTEGGARKQKGCACLVTNC